MSESLEDFLIGVATDPDRAARFLQNPLVEAEGVGLGPDERAALLARDARRIRLAMEGGLRFENQSTQGDAKKPGGAGRRRHRDHDRDYGKRPAKRRKPAKSRKRPASRKRRASK